MRFDIITLFPGGWLGREKKVIRTTDVRTWFSGCTTNSRHGPSAERLTDPSVPDWGRGRLLMSVRRPAPQPPP